MGNYIKAKDRIGMTIGNFEILELVPVPKCAKPIYKIKCKLCGNVCEMRVDCVLNPKVVSCGCFNRENNHLKSYDDEEVVNKVFNYMLVTERVGKNDKGRTLYKCQCVKCGKEYIDQIPNIKRRKFCECHFTKEYYENGLINYGQKSNKDYGYKNSKIYSLNPNREPTMSGCIGVIWDKRRSKWLAQINFQGKRYHLGRYDDKELAILARKTAERELYTPYFEEFISAKPDMRDKAIAIIERIDSIKSEIEKIKEKTQ